MRLAEFERDGAAFCSALSREHYLHGAGLKVELEIGPIFNRFRHLFELETFEELRGLPLDEPLGEKYRRFLLDFIASSHLENAVTEHSEAIAQAEASTTIAWGERELSYRAVPVVCANERDPDRRHELNELWRTEQERLNPQRVERHRGMLGLVSELDAGDYVELCDGLRGLGLARLVERMNELLASTADLYRDSLRDALADQGLTPSTAWNVDLSYVFRGTDFDTRFPKERLTPTLVSTLRDLGFDIESQRNIMLDIEPRSMKSPRAFCSPIDIPNDVRLVLQPMGGHQDYDTLLHEAGHAEHYANADPALPFGYKRLGDDSVTEGYAFLLNYLGTDRVWLRHQLDFGDSEDYRRFVLFQKLYMLRRYATKLLYESELQRASDPQPMAERYAELFSDYLMVRYFPAGYLADVDDFFYSALYLRAWMFEAQFREYLKKEYDEEWFRAPRAGKFIQDLWREGQKYTADELVKFMGYDELDHHVMLREIREALAR